MQRKTVVALLTIPTFLHGACGKKENASTTAAANSPAELTAENLKQLADSIAMQLRKPEDAARAATVKQYTAEGWTSTDGYNLEYTVLGIDIKTTDSALRPKVGVIRIRRNFQDTKQLTYHTDIYTLDVWRNPSGKWELVKANAHVDASTISPGKVGQDTDGSWLKPRIDAANN